MPASVWDIMENMMPPISTDLFDFKFKVAVAASNAMPRDLPAGLEGLGHAVDDFFESTEVTVGVYSDAVRTASALWQAVKQALLDGHQLSGYIDKIGVEFRADIRRLVCEIDGMVSEAEAFVALIPALSDVIARYGELRRQLLVIDAEIEQHWFPPTDKETLERAIREAKEGRGIPIEDLIAELDD